MLKRIGEKVVPEFIEEEFISAIETAINRSYYFRDKAVGIQRISQSDENELGYDGVLGTIVPFYIQFKRSDFYSPNFSGKLTQDRTKVGLKTDHGYFAFELLRKNKNYDQHNAMYLLSQRSKAAYVAPMFYKRHDLDRLRSESVKFLPLSYDYIHFYRPDLERIMALGGTLLFKKTITIFPHAPINDQNASHHYSYCRANYVGFHSDPINLQEGSSTNMRYFLRDVIYQSDQRKEEVKTNFELLPELFNIESNSSEFQDILTSSINRISIVEQDEDAYELLEKLSDFDKLLIMEDILFHYFNIRQYVCFQYH